MEKIGYIKDFYGHQRNVDDAFGLMREYVLGDMRYEVSHVVVNKELYIQVKDYLGAYMLFASYDHKSGFPNTCTAMVYLNRQQSCELERLRQLVSELPSQEGSQMGFMIDGVWDSIIIYESRKTGYTWGVKPVPPYHVLQELVNTIYRFLPPENGHLIERIDSDNRYAGLLA